MPFIHAPIFWLGLACVSLPIIIHLLNRRRFRIRPWAAMQFLLDSVRRNKRRLRIEELILLLLRCLAILALAIAVARIFTESDLPGSTDSHTSVFVLDDTYSMDQQVASKAIFRTAAEDIVEQIKKLPKSSKVAIVLASAPATAKPLFALDLVENIDPEDLNRRLASLQTSDKRIGVVEMIEKGAKMIRNESGAKRLWLLSDFRKGDLKVEQVPALRAQYNALRVAGIEFVALDYGHEAHNNLTIESIELLERFALRGEPLRIRVTVRNNAREKSGAVRLTGTVRFAADTTASTDDTATGDDAIPLGEQTIPDIPAGRVGEFTFPLRATKSGSAVVSVALADDELAGDNAAHLALNIHPSQRALIVDGRPHPTDPAQSESWSYIGPLDPKGGASTGISVEVIAPDELGAKDLELYNFIALLDVAELTSITGTDGREVYPSLRKLERYVRGGGGLAIYTGENLDLAFYNGPLHAGGLGLSPYRIGEPVRTTEYFRLDPRSIVSSGEGSPMWIFDGQLSFHTAMVRFTAFTPTEASSAAPAAGDILPPRVLARFTDANASVAMAVRQFGKGTVAMAYTAATNRRWHDWTKTYVYAPFVKDTFLYIARTQPGRAGQQVGAPIVHRLSSRHAGLTSSLKSPGQPRVQLLPLEGFNPSAKATLSDLADRLAANEGQTPSDKALVEAGLAAKKALDDNDLAVMEETLKQAADVLKDARGQSSPAGRLYAELTGLTDTGLGELFGRELRFERADRCGVYELTVQARDASTTFFARNTDPGEGDLAHIADGKEDLVAVFGSQEFIYKDRSAAGSAADVSQTTDKREYWLWAMGALLALLAIETFLGQRFGHYETTK